MNQRKKAKKLFLGNSISYKASNFIYRALLKLNILESTFHKIYKLEKVESKIEMLEDAFIRNVRAKPFVFLDGWGFNSEILHLKHKQTIKELFLPNESDDKHAKKIMQGLQKTSDTIIGVHVRRGDYEHFEGGRYYFGFEDYVSFMEATNELFGNRSICFLVVSNEDCLAKFQEFKRSKIHISQQSAMVDLLLLTMCDYIIGPPSTFSLWASYCNNIPQILIRSKDQSFDICDFKTYDERRLEG
ncbi:MAG: hypothetical protein HC819_02930 [Cyclobacteriaceae bacterium]|nr:hypothetical protein [Cyclobacteriaceae bacterium]